MKIRASPSKPDESTSSENVIVATPFGPNRGLQVQRPWAKNARIVATRIGTVRRSSAGSVDRAARVELQRLVRARVGVDLQTGAER